MNRQTFFRVTALVILAIGAMVLRSSTLDKPNLFPVEVLSLSCIVGASVWYGALFRE